MSNINQTISTATAGDRDRIIRSFVVEQYLPDVDPAAITAERDLLGDGIIDSLGLLKLIAWVEDTFDVIVSDDDLDPDNFRSIAAIDGYVAGSTAALDV
jgi:acyl carrier protein